MGSEQAKWQKVRALALLGIFLASGQIAAIAPCRAAGLADLAPRSRDFLSEGNEVRILGLVEAVEATCPPSKCVYVGLGRSPTPLIAALQAKHGDAAALNLPLSGFHVADPGRVAFLEGMRGPLSGSERAALVQHLDHFLGPRIESARRQGKRLVAIDYADTGATIVSFRSQFDRYLKTVGPIEWGIIGITSNGDAHGLARALQPVQAWERRIPIRLLELKSEALANEFAFQRFDGLSEYGKFVLWEKADADGYYRPPSRRPDYDALKDELRTKIDHRAGGAPLSTVRITPEEAKAYEAGAVPFDLTACPSPMRLLLPRP